MPNKCPQDGSCRSTCIFVKSSILCIDICCLETRSDYNFIRRNNPGHSNQGQKPFVCARLFTYRPYPFWPKLSQLFFLARTRFMMHSSPATATCPARVAMEFTSGCPTTTTTSLFKKKRSHVTETFSKVVGQHLFENSEEFALSFRARIDMLYLTEQELLCDSEVCAIGQMAARQILDGADAALAISRAKVEAWKLEAEAVESLMVRFKARECDEVPIEQLQRDLRRRREQASLKLFDRFDRVSQARCPLDEASMMEEAMNSVLAHIEEEYAGVSQDKAELSQIFFDLQQALQELLRATTDILLPRLMRISMRSSHRHIGLSVGRAVRIMVGVAAIPAFCFPPTIPVDIACASTALGLQVAVSTVEAVGGHLQDKCLTEAFRDDAILCDSVLVAAGKLADHLDTLEPHSLHHLLPLATESCSFSRSFVRGMLDYVPVVSIVKASVDMATSCTEGPAHHDSIKQCVKQVEVENDNIRSLLDIVTKSCDFGQVPVAVPNLGRIQSCS